MLTRCPACSTTFRVQPEQLKARQGKVRCGECQRVFSALDSLIEEFVLPSSVPATDYDESRNQEGSAFPAAQYRPIDADAALAKNSLRTSDLADVEGNFVSEADAAPLADAVPSGDAISPGLTFVATVPEVSAQGEGASTLIASPEHTGKGSSEGHDLPAIDVPFDAPVGEPTMEVETLVLDATRAAETLVPLALDQVAPGEEFVVTESPVTEVLQPAATSSEPEPLALATPAPDVHSLVAAAPSDEFEPDLHSTPRESTGLSIWLWAAGIIIAIVVLIVQGLMTFRVELSTMAPQTRHIFVTACDLVGCTVDLPKKIELLSIESSDLHPDPAFPDQAGHLGVQLSLRNRAPFAQTWPHLELSLTDTSDTVIVRRVFTAKDYLIARAPSDAMLAQGIGPREDVALELALDVGELVASGYRLYLFYP